MYKQIFLVLGIILVPTIAVAQNSPKSEASGFYSGVGGGLTLIPDSDLSATYSGGPLSGSVEFDPGFSVSAFGGYKWDFGLRTEIEYRFTRATLDKGTLNSPSLSGSVGGDVQAHHFFANAWYDFDFGRRWMPYVGGGAGGVLVRGKIDDIPALGVTSGSDTDFVFGGQAGGGIGYALSPHIAVDLGYRYVITQDPSFANGIPGLSNIDAEYSSHNVMFSIRGHFDY